ncbi:hypothetical protein [Methylobacterium oxalidis]|uniref:Transposase n=1 Tax=Methylobacterium oxalidis TaxID=944322 RepID=A0A512J8N8_9HYPH|nr:hypothetical protein [Methylobacterium oxalidis]GEP06325.1 hypothetical protein MOX02_43630 [Methylobacterium oxalidis]GJE30891.1 hypothetical protein LDDCCGHA_1061 [Methylobacterium oxalidis]GLS64374.1 hypothetical protein GCM10007888_27550 [Methylobacterium oxalidis]
MPWSVTDELAVTRRHLAEEEARRCAQIALIKTLTERGQSVVETEHALRETEASLMTLRARRSYLEVLQRHP